MRYPLPPPRLLLLLYGLTLLLALPLTWTMFSTLNAEAGQSMAPAQLLGGFDYTVFDDFWAQSGRAVWPLLRMGWLLALLSVLLWTWATGGLLRSFSDPARGQIRFGLFWQAGTQYWVRYVRLLGVTVLFTLAVFTVPFLIGMLLAVAFADSLTERGLAGLGFGGFAVGGLGTLLVWCIADYAKVLMYRTDEHGAFRAYGQAGRFVLRHPRATLGRYLGLVALGAGLLGLYLFIDALLTMRNWPLIILVAVLQQAIIIGRVALRVVTLRVAYEVTHERLRQPTRQADAPDQPGTLTIT